MLGSDTFGWPAAQDTVADSITAIQDYDAFWQRVEKAAPSGVRGDAQDVVAAAADILRSVKTNRVLSDGDNVARLRQVAAVSGIPDWVSQYCT